MEELLLKMCYENGLKYSHDNRTTNYALIIDNNTDLVSCGANRFAGNLKVTEERLNNRELKLKYIVHAEQMAILMARRDVRGMTMICPYASCTECCKDIIQSGIFKLVRHKQIMDRIPERWKYEVTLGTNMLLEAGVEIVNYDKIIGCETLFDGERVKV